MVLRDLVFFDSAICSTFYRDKFLRVIAHENGALFADNIFDLNCGSVRKNIQTNGIVFSRKGSLGANWISCRKVKIRIKFLKLLVENDLELQTILSENLQDRAYLHVESLKVCQLGQAGRIKYLKLDYYCIKTICNRYPSLQSLHFQDCTSPNFVGTHGIEFSELTELSVTSCHNIFPALISLLTKISNKLNILHITSTDIGIYGIFEDRISLFTSLLRKINS